MVLGLIITTGSYITGLHFKKVKKLAFFAHFITKAKRYL